MSIDVLLRRLVTKRYRVNEKLNNFEILKDKTILRFSYLTGFHCKYFITTKQKLFVVDATIYTKRIIKLCIASNGVLRNFQYGKGFWMTSRKICDRALGPHNPLVITFNDIFNNYNIILIIYI